MFMQKLNDDLIARVVARAKLTKLRHYVFHFDKELAVSHEYHETWIMLVYPDGKTIYSQSGKEMIDNA
jgi:hypothetical protein